MIKFYCQKIPQISIGKVLGFLSNEGRGAGNVRKKKDCMVAEDLFFLQIITESFLR